MNQGLSALLVATASGGLISMDHAAITADKYSMAVCKAREVAELNKSYGHDPKPDLLACLTTKFDGLLGFLLSSFRSEPTADDVHAVMHNRTGVDALSADQVARLAEGVVPVAIVRELIKEHQIAMNVRALTNWRPFLSRYKSQVMAA